MPAFAAIAALALLITAPAAPGAGNSEATITGKFSDSCRDFEGHAYKLGTEAPKDISHVEIQYVNGAVVKDESVAAPDYLLDGDEGEELDFVIVKSGTTTETFTCTATNSPPTAVLERKAGSSDPQNAPGTWTSDDCVWPDCFYSVPTDGATVPDESAVSFRGISSTDLDIVSWSIDFGDGTTPASGSWVTGPPVWVVHDYNMVECICTATLTVTDSAGQSSSDPMAVSMIRFGTHD